jgi:hypothetical protein
LKYSRDVQSPVIMEKVSKAILRYLFQEYVKGPTILYSINCITDLYKVDPIAVSDYLVEKKWVREQWIHQNNLVACRITVEGIEEINPLFIRNKLKKLIGGLMDGGGRKSLTEIFQNKIEEYSIALDIIYQLEKMGLVAMVHQKGSIDIELTTYGWQYFEKQGKPLLTLMSIA